MSRYLLLTLIACLGLTGCTVSAPKPDVHVRTKVERCPKDPPPELYEWPEKLSIEVTPDMRDLDPILIELKGEHSGTEKKWQAWKTSWAECP